MIDPIFTLTHLGYWIQAHPTPVIFGIIVMLSLLKCLSVVQAKQHPESHGSARWASLKEIDREGLLSPVGLVLGEHSGHILRHAGEDHMLLVAPTRAGKGVGFILPTLLTWSASAIVLDPKNGENAKVTAWKRERLGPVYRFNPCARPQTRINVLRTIRLGTPHEIGDASDIMQSLLAPHEQIKQSDTGAHFGELSAMAGTAILLHVAYAYPRKSLPGCWEFLTDKSLPETLHIMATTNHTPAGPHPGIVRLAQAIQNISNEKELSGVWTTLVRPFSLYMDPLVARSTDGHDLMPEELQHGAKPATLYLEAPSPLALTRLHQVYRVILDVYLKRLMARAPGQYPRQLLCVLDEMASFGYSPILSDAFATAAGYGIRLMAVVQNIDQLSRATGNDGTIWGNTNLKAFMAPGDDRTAKRLAENMLGKSTIQVQGSSVQGGPAGRTSRSYHAHGRPLLTADELMTMALDKVIILKAGSELRPVLAQRLFAPTDPRFE